MDIQSNIERIHSPNYSPLAQDDWPLFMISGGQLAPFSSKLAETLNVKSDLGYTLCATNRNILTIAIYWTVFLN